MRRTMFAVLAVAAALLSCLLATSSAMAQAPVVIDATDQGTQRFEPASVTVNTGQVVRWEFDEAATTHTVTSTSANWSINESRGPNGAAIERTFDTPGLYTFNCTIHPAMTGSVTVQDAPPEDQLENVLVFSKTAGFRHTSIDEGIAAIELLGTQNDFNVDATEDSAQFTDANLAQYDAVIWLSTTGDVLNANQQAAFRRYIQAGGGYVGIHSASDTEYTWGWYGQLVGGYFRNHPGATDPQFQQATVDVEDADEPSTDGLPAEWVRTDEWYNFQSPINPNVGGGGTDYSPRNSGVHVLAALDESTYAEEDGNATDDDHPISWCSEFDGGTAWYTGAGHTEASFTEANFLTHILGGIQTAARSEEADCGEARQATPTADDFEKVTLDDDTQNPFELDVAPDGRVFYIERNGEIRIIKANGQVVVAGEIPVYTGQENGLMGMQLDPNFEETGWIYLAYSDPGTQRPNTQVVARFEVVGDSIDMLSKQEIFTWTHQRETCCHSSGSLYFGPDGSLYVSTGDNTNPFDSGGFAPIDERSGVRPPTDGDFANLNYSSFDAQRTSANTNDLNGKILRIMPLPNASGAPGEGTTYTVPTGNLFPEAEDTANQTRPEIFAMGFRNPFRFTVDPETGWVLMGDYGPDAGATVDGRGPQGSVEFNTVTQAGNYGWPYCIRDNTPYNDYNFATGESGAPFNCAAPVNQSPNNTGRTNLPPAIGADAWMGYSEQDPRHVPDLGGGGAPTGGPRYHYDPDGPPTQFPEIYDGLWFNGEWNNGWIKTFELDGTGAVTDVGPFPFLGPEGCVTNTGGNVNSCYKRPMDMDFGPDGSLYLIEWGSGFGGNNPNSAIYRIDYVAEGRRPIATGTGTPDNGPAPLTVQFSSAGSIDPDGTSLTYAWDFDGDGDTDSTEPNPSHTYNTAGNFTATLTVTDQSGQTGIDNIPITVGNTRPVVTIEIPEEGQFAGFGETIPYEITVTDAEDGSTGAGTIDCDDVTLNISLGHDDHAHELSEQQGCEGTFIASSDGGHGGNVNTFPVIEAVYTDTGGSGGAAGPLTGRDIQQLQPKRKQAEFFTSTGRASGVTGGGAPGVQTETTTDEGGGVNIGFIENGDYVSYEPMNLKDITGIRFRVASGGAGGTIQVRTGAPDGPLVAETATIAPTGGWQNWTSVELALSSPPTGVHELFFVFRHPTDQGGLMNLNWIQFLGKGAANTAAPEVTATADPETGIAPLEVSFDAEATDPEGGALTYLWDFGVAGTSDDTSTEEDPTFTYERAGTYTARVTVEDPDGGEATDTVQVRVTTSDECPTGPVRSDEFEGDALDTNRWSVIRPDGTRPPTVSGGNLNFPIDNGSIYGPGEPITRARNIIVQPLPEGRVEVTAKITTDPLTENYHQAGLRVYADDDNWASVHMIGVNGGRDFEFIWESNGNARNDGADKLGGIPADSPLTYWVRIVSDGTQLTALYSFDGEDFLPVGRPGSLATFNNPQIGPAALSDQAPSFPVARFDWIRFNPDESTGGGGGGGELFADQFDGTTLGSGWSVVRQDQLMNVSGGALRIPAQPGDLYQTRNDAKNLVLRDAPDGEWVATAKLNFEGTAQYHQAGILVYGDDANFTKFGRIAHSGTGDEKFEFIYENNSVARNDPPPVDSTANLPADFPDDFWVRMTSDGTNVTGEYSINGTDWTDVGRPAPLPANARIGMFAFSNDATGNPEAAFDSFKLEQPGAGGGPSRDDQFDGTSLDTGRWNGIVRGNPDAYEVADGELTITTETGDIYSPGATTPPPNNFILQSADHAGADWVIETKLSGTIDGGYSQGGLIAYVDDDNYVKWDAISDPGNTRINRLELRSEVNGTVPTGGDPEVTVEEGTTDIWLRLAKTGTTYRGYYSFDGTTWEEAVDNATPPVPVTNPMASPRFGLYAYGVQQAGDTVSFDYFTLDGEDEPCVCEGSGDDFEGASLDKDRWNNIVREQEDLYNLADGNLNVTTVNGDIYEGGDPAPTRNFFLQSADHAGEDWVIETKVDAGELSMGYEQAGLLAFQDEGDYVKFDVLSDDQQTVLNRIELRSEENNVIQSPQPNNAAALPAGTEVVWLRLTKTGDMYKGEYSFDGTTWTEVTASGVPAQVQNDMVDPAFGLFTLGVNSGGGTAHFEYFSVDGDATGCPDPDPENRAPQIPEIAADPTIGVGPLEVDFDVTATDPDEGDELTYAWDFGDGGTSTEEDPTHTYTAPGTYQAEVTVSDGEDDATRTVEVQVLGPDEAGSRFRTLVFSKTAGFRHSSIDEGHAAIEAMGVDEDFHVDHTEDATAFRADVLELYDTVVFLSTTGDVLNEAQQTAFEDYIQGGGGYTGIHSASDTEYEWNWYGHLVGAYFMSHPANQDATIHVEDQTHPSTAGKPASYERFDEWYNFRSPDFADPNVPDGDYSPRGAADIHILERIDETTYDEGDGNTTDDDHPMTWCQRYDGGQSWYTAQGHVEDSFNAAHEDNILQQILGGLETTAGVAANADCGTGDPDAPTVEGFANPRTGAAPLVVQFSATGTDPQNGELRYRWTFGDGGGASLDADPQHTYRTPGTFTATVTATDPQGKTATDSVEIVVTQAGNQAPTVEAAGDPVEGDAPLLVRFTAQGSDPDGPGPLTYLWDFDDGGSNAFGRTVTHRYMEPGTYTATVTATDGRGAFDTAEVEITVEDPPGNMPPNVQVAADPRSGTAPLTVRFTSAATDPDGDRLSAVWDFGNGDQAGGESATYTYTVPGTYTARLTVRDPGGLTDTETVQITVAGTAGAGGGGAPPPAGAVAPPPDTGGVAGEDAEVRPLVVAPKAQKVRRVARRGLRVRVSCEDRCRVSSVLRLSGRRLGASKAGLTVRGSRTIVLRLDRNVRRNLLAAMRQAGVKRLKTTLVTRIVTADGTRTIRAKVTLKL